jgi:hypothetical protein
LGIAIGTNGCRTDRSIIVEFTSTAAITLAREATRWNSRIGAIIARIFVDFHHRAIAIGLAGIIDIARETFAFTNRCAADSINTSMGCTLGVIRTWVANMSEIGTDRFGPVAPSVCCAICIF